jgi:hypothetical protein
MRRGQSAMGGTSRGPAAVAAVAFALLLPASTSAAPPSNDNFANAAVLAGDVGTSSGTVSEATSEPSEPAEAGDAALQSVWYRWAPAVDGIATFDVCTADFDSRLAVFTGDSLAHLIVVTSNDDSEACGADSVQSSVEFAAEAGTTYEIVVDGFGGAGNFSLAWARQPLAPTNSAPPGVTGAAHDGATLSATHGEWSGEGTLTYSYQWQRCNSTAKNVALGRPAYASQTLGPENLPQMAVDGSRPTYWNSGGFAPQWIAVDLQAPYPISTIRAAIAQLPEGYTVHDISVAGANPLDDFAPLAHFAGSTNDRQTLEATGPSNQVEYIRIDTSASPSWVAWQEIEALSRCADIAGATGATYVVASEDIGSTIRAVARASNATGPTAAASSETAVVVGNAPLNTSAPSISGNAAVFETLTASLGSWTGSQPLSYAYAWQRCKGATCTAIDSANEATYDTDTVDEGFGIRVVVSASNAAGSASATAPATSVIPYTCEVPFLRGQTLAAARRALVAEHCRLGKVGRAYSRAVKRGRVVSQAPRAYRSLRGGAKVSVVVSRGPRRAPRRR